LPLLYSLSHLPQLAAFLSFSNATAPLESYTFPYTTLFRSQWQVADQAGRTGAYLSAQRADGLLCRQGSDQAGQVWPGRGGLFGRSEDHTSELQSRGHLVCRLLLEKKKCKCTRRMPYS